MIFSILRSNDIQYFLETFLMGGRGDCITRVNFSTLTLVKYRTKLWTSSPKKYSHLKHIKVKQVSPPSLLWNIVPSSELELMLFLPPKKYSHLKTYKSKTSFSTLTLVKNRTKLWTKTHAISSHRCFSPRHFSSFSSPLYSWGCSFETNLETDNVRRNVLYLFKLNIYIVCVVCNF